MCFSSSSADQRSGFFSSRSRHTRCLSDWSSVVCSSDLDIAALLGVLFHQRIEKRFRDSKSCPPKTVDCLSEVNQAALRRNIENPQRAGYAESLAASHHHALAIIHEQQIGAERNGQGDCGRLPFVESFHGTMVELMAGLFVYFKPGRRIGDPVPYRRWSVRVRQFGLHGGWQGHFLK